MNPSTVKSPVPTAQSELAANDKYSLFDGTNAILPPFNFVGVGVCVIVGVFVLVTDGVIVGVTEIVGVLDGVIEGVIVGLGVT